MDITTVIIVYLCKYWHDTVNNDISSPRLPCHPVIVFSYMRYIFWIFMVLSHLAHEDTPPMSSFCHHVVLWYIWSSPCTWGHTSPWSRPPSPSPRSAWQRPERHHGHHQDNHFVIMTFSFILEIINLSSWSLLVSSWSLFMWCWSAPSQGRPQASRWTSQSCTSWSDWRLGCFYSFIYLQPRWPEIKANLHIYSRYFDLIVPKNNICFISSLPFNWHFFRTQKKIQVFRKKLSPISTPCRWSVRYLDSLHQTLSACWTLVYQGTPSYLA